MPLSSFSSRSLHIVVQNKILLTQIGEFSHSAMAALHSGRALVGTRKHQRGGCLRGGPGGTVLAWFKGTRLISYLEN